ncbi:MAG: LemA family protein [Crocinitomicaceae bacterium]
MEDYKEEQFKAHIKAVVEASQQKSDDSLEERPLSLSELKELAIEMGLSSEQWDDLQKKAGEHLKTADDHLKARNFNEAIVEAEKAMAINPYIENGNAVLARSYLMLWLQTHENEHRDRAEMHARNELKVDPRDQIAVNVLSTIDKKRRILEGDSRSKKSIFIVLGVIIVIVVGGLIFYSQSSNKRAVEMEQNQLTYENQTIRDELIVAEEEVNSKWDLVQIAIDQRNNMIPDLFKAIQTSSADIDALNQSIEKLQEKIKNAEGEERFTLENDLSAKIQEMKSIARESGDAANVKTLMVQIEGSENRIAYEKKNYNEAVKHYNILVKKHGDKFPSYEIKPYFSNQ